MNPLDFSEEHRRLIQSTFWALDEMMCLFERWAKKQDIQSLLFQEINNLSEEQCHLISEHIATIRKITLQTSTEMELAKRNRDVEDNIRSMCILFIANSIFNLTRRGMENYGKPPEELVKYLEPKLAELTEQLEQIADIVSEKK